MVRDGPGHTGRQSDAGIYPYTFLASCYTAGEEGSRPTLHLTPFYDLHVSFLAPSVGLSVLPADIAITFAFDSCQNGTRFGFGTLCVHGLYHFIFLYLTSAVSLSRSGMERVCIHVGTSILAYTTFGLEAVFGQNLCFLL